MKNNLIFLLGFFLISNLTGFSQSSSFDASNARDGETVEYCHQHKKTNALKQNPAYLQALQQDEVIRQHEANNIATPKGVVYKIPVVFHVLHNNGIENIADEQILDALFILNRDYRLQNTDANNVHAEFQGMPSDVEIEFVLATKAPNGTCFAGITRTASAMSYIGDNGGNQVDAIVAGNNVYNGSWPGNKYMNIFICGEIGGAAGYTTKPSSWSATSMENGIWILHDYVGSIGTGSTGASRALTHEVGHWLNLDHTWGGNNNPGNTSSCSTDDAVTDTPNCIGVTSCNQNSNTCNSDDAFWGFTIRDNVENYMDYSYCSKMFSAGQVTRMRNAITSNVGGRSNLWTSANLLATGANGVIYLCKAEFSANKTSVCVGDQVQFTDNSYNVSTGWTWSFPSGSPASSTSQNPIVTYSTPGIYEVTLTATDGATTDSEVKTQYIHVFPSAASLPFYEGFENYSSLSNLANWEIVNANNNNAFVLDNTVGHTGSKSVKLSNFGQTGPNVDELIASPVDLSGVTSGTGVTLSFRYAYRKKALTDFEYLKVLVTDDCGDSWVIRKTIGGNTLSNIAVASSWSPVNASDWTTVHMVNITSAYWIENFRYKFKFEGETGNNIFLDDINIYAGAASNEIVLGVSEQNEIGNVALFPNPSEGELNLRFSATTAAQANIQIMDVYGKVNNIHTIQAAAGSNLIMLDSSTLSAGIYFLSLQVGEGKSVMQFVIK
jgi:PKD repeat protein